MFIVYALIVFLILVFVHELGHFLAARKVGIGVNEFAIGMGPKLLSKQKGETLFSLRAVPFGGYCKMEGEDEESEHPDAFNNKPARSRVLVLLSGSLFNIIFAAIILMVIIFSQGQPTMKIDTVDENAPVYIAGMQQGDEIISINNKPVENWGDVNVVVSDIIIEEVGPEKPAAGQSVTDFDLDIKVKSAAGEEKIITAPLYIDENREYKIGITPVIKYTPLFALKSVGYGFQATWNMTKMMYDVLGKLVTGRESLDEITGPVGIVLAVGDTVEHGFIYVLQLTALISLNLGIVNLLPFPALDGGRIFFLIIRQITGKRISDTFEGIFHFVGFVILIGFMLFITYRDIAKLFIN